MKTSEVCYEYIMKNSEDWHFKYHHLYQTCSQNVFITKIANTPETLMFFLKNILNKLENEKHTAI